MKKLRFKTSLGVVLALSFLVGCSNKGSSSDQGYTNSDAKPSEPTIKKEPAKEDNIVDGANHNGVPPAQPSEQPGEPGEQPSQANLACNSEDDCALIPNNDCFGCLKPGGSHVVTTQKHASQLWQQKRQACEPELKKFFESMQAEKRELKKEEMSQDPSCLAFNGVACQQGQCVGVLLNDEQLKARAEKIQRLRQQGQQGQGQRGPQMGGQAQPMNGRQAQPMNGGQAQPMNGRQGGPAMGGQQ